MEIDKASLPPKDDDIIKMLLLVLPVLGRVFLFESDMFKDINSACTCFFFMSFYTNNSPFHQGYKLQEYLLRNRNLSFLNCRKIAD